ncbi:MAG TPA: transglutaminase family protein [Acetobacteraceae bacterium]|nr:transglutaminase family protein [Acetobacteraceae bacterium]
MKYRLRHVTAYRYSEPVDLATHMLHLSPLDRPGQEVLRAAIHTAPDPARRSEGIDHFGNRVTWLFLHALHQDFSVTSEAEVAVAFAPPPADEETPAWEEVARLAAAAGPGAWEAAEFLFDSPHAPADASVRAWLAPPFTPGRPILAALRELLPRFKADFKFCPGVTTIATPVAKVLAARAGVCQDFSHVMIAGLRALGLPARYASGYLRTRPPPGAARRFGVDQSHAWVECWLGPAHGWLGLDPTNNLVVHDEHVLIAVGRDYADVSPVRGVILGGGAHDLTVSVDLEPV